MKTISAKRRAIAGLLGPFLVCFAAFYIIPICYAVYQSLFQTKRTGQLGSGGVEDVFVGLANYADALSNSAFLASLGRVSLYALVQVPVMIGLAATLALLLDAAAARGVPFFRTAYFLPYGVPGVIASILWGFLYTPGVSPIVQGLDALGVHFSFLSSSSILWSIGNIVIWEFAGYNTLVIVAQLKAIDSDLYEAARIDGANAWQIATRIKLPLIRPALVLTTVFTIIGTLQLFSEPLVLQKMAPAINSEFTPNMAAYNEAFMNNNYPLAAAEAVLLAVLAAVLSFGFLGISNRRSRKES